MKRTHLLYLFLSAALLFSGCTTRQSQHNESNQANQTPSTASSEFDKDTSTPDDSANAAADSASDDTSQIISADEAESIAITHAGYAKDQVTITQNKLDYENGRQVYEIEFYTADSKEYDYEIDALTKDILRFEQDSEHHAPSASGTESAAISAEDAKSLALARVPGAAPEHILEFETDYDHERTEYEGKICYNGIEYEFEIDAADGSFLSWEEEYE